MGGRVDRSQSAADRHGLVVGDHGLLVQAGVESAVPEAMQHRGPLSRAGRGCQHALGEPLRHRRDARIEIDVRVLGEAGFDREENGGVESGHLGQRDERGAPGVHRECRIRDEEGVEALRRVGPASRCGREERDRAGRVDGRPSVGVASEQCGRGVDGPGVGS